MFCCLLIFFSFFQFSFLKETSMISDYYRGMYNILKKQLNISEDSSDYEECSSALNFALDNPSEYDTLSKIIKYSGKNLSDLGMYYQCEQEKLKYSLIVLVKEVTKKNGRESNDIKVSIFLNQSDFLYGLCIIDNCTSFINSTTFNRAVGDMTKSSSTVFLYDSPGTNGYTFGLTFLIILLILLFIKIIVWIYIGCKTQETKQKFRTQLDVPTPSLDDSSSISYLDNTIKDKDLPLFPGGFNNSSHAPISFKESCCNKIVEIFDLCNSMTLLVDKKNKYYDDTNIEIISFFRFIVVLCMIYNHNYYSLIKIPIRNSESISYYTSIKMVFYKLSTFGVAGWIGLDGFVFSYKLFSYLKKNIELNKGENKNASFILFVKFYLNSLVKVFSMIIIFLILSYKINDFNELFSFPPTFDYFSNYLNKRTCTSNFWSIFIPFFFSYADIFDDNPRGFTNCFKYVNIGVNTHLCFIFLLLIFYISFKLKSRIFDWLILILFILNSMLIYCSVFFLYNDKENDKYFNVNYLFGENFTLKYTHLFINLYLIGVFVGIIYFYYIDVISSKPLDSQINYSPFGFCLSLVKILDSLSNAARNIIVILCCIIILIFSSIFYFTMLIKGDLLFELGFYKYIDMYEKIIFLLAFMMIILVLLFTKGSTAFKSLTQKGIFTLVDRISFGMFCSMDNAIYLFYTSYPIVLILDFSNLMMTAIGLIFIIAGFNLMYNILLEQPFRIIVKSLTQNCTVKEKDS